MALRPALSNGLLFSSVGKFKWLLFSKARRVPHSIGSGAALETSQNALEFQADMGKSFFESPSEARIHE